MPGPVLEHGLCGEERVAVAAILELIEDDLSEAHSALLRALHQLENALIAQTGCTLASATRASPADVAA